MFDAFLTADGLIALVTLTVLEIVLGIDNVIFISILAGKLPPAATGPGAQVGPDGGDGHAHPAAGVARLDHPADRSRCFTIGTRHPLSGRDLILIVGGLFLLFKATHEIHEKLEGEEGHMSARVTPSFAAVIAQIMVLDIVFSLDSVITAVGMADDLSVMVAAVVLAVGVMMLAAGSISAFVDQHPTVKVLALSFLLLIGCSLVADGFGLHVPKGYIYFAMGFSVFVEMINLRMAKKRRAKANPVKLHEPYIDYSDPLDDRILDGVVHLRLVAPARLQHAERVVAALDRQHRDRRRRGGAGNGFLHFVGAAERIARPLHDQRRHRQRPQVRDAIAGPVAARRRERIAERDHAGGQRRLRPRVERGGEVRRDAPAHRLAADEEVRGAHVAMGHGADHRAAERVFEHRRPVGRLAALFHVRKVERDHGHAAAAERPRRSWS